MKSQAVPTPEQLRASFPVTSEAEKKIAAGRQALRRIFRNDDKRLLAVVGPCSLDDSGAALEFANRMREFWQHNSLESRLQLVVRVPPAKPRTEGGWHGLEHDSVEKARELLVELANAGHMIAMEAIKPVHFARYSDLAALMWVGARNVNDSFIRMAASVYGDLPILFKNAHDGDIRDAARAMNVAAQPTKKAQFIGMDGLEHVMELSPGAESTAIVLRGGKEGHNITPAAVSQAVDEMRKRDITDRGVIIDVSHSNGAAFSKGSKSAAGQITAFQEVLKLLQNPDTRPHVRGVMMEAYLQEGTGKAYGQSRTDPTLDIKTAQALALQLASLVDGS
jgi:3-deoxy-7-phosphoheptulonate synthase